MNSIEIITQELTENKIIVGILIGLFGYMSVDIKSYIDKYLNPVIQFNKLIEKAYLNLRFSNSSFNEIVKIFDIDNPCIPNYFKYAILKQDYLALESLIVLNYSKYNDGNYMIIFNSMRFILITLVMLLSFIFTVFFFIIIVSSVYILPLGLLSAFLTRNKILLIVSLSSIIFFSFNFIKILDYIKSRYSNSLYASFSAIENEENYENTLKIFKDKYNILRMKGYKLRLNIYQDDYNI